MPKTLSETELEAFLAAFDLNDPVGLRDYAIARCLLDLGLRGHEATFLTLESIDWRRSILSIGSTKSRRVQQLPIPAVTAEAIARYLRHVLTVIADHPVNRVDELLPWNVTL